MFEDNYNIGIGGGLGFTNGLNAVPVYGALSKKDFEDSARLNISRKVNSMALTRFKWLNLPDTMKASQIEKLLYLFGLAVVFYDDESNGLVVLPASVNGVELDVFGDPIDIEGTRSDGTAVHLTNKVDCILLGNDPYYTGDFSSLQGFTDQIVKLENSRRNNGSRLTSIPVFQTDNSNIQGATIDIIEDAINDNAFGIMSATRQTSGRTGRPSRAPMDGTFSFLDFTEAYHGSELDNEINLNWERIADTLGVNTAHRSTDSGISDEEINKNSDIGHASGIASFEFRTEKAEEINKMFNTNIRVVWYDNEKQQEIDGGNETNEI